jgi:acetyltransferase-like isoleucine patch superfamily enzyme
VDNEVTLGAGARMGARSYLTAGSVVEDDVEVGEDVVTTNDDTMGRHPPGAPVRGVALRRGCRVGDRAVLVPGVEVGAGAVVADDALVTRDVPPGATVAGAPARPAS